jgi:hypothetical protein
MTPKFAIPVPSDLDINKLLALLAEPNIDDLRLNNEVMTSAIKKTPVYIHALSTRNKQLIEDVQTVMGYLLERDELIELCKSLLKGADTCVKPPHNIYQPFVGIVGKHTSLITKYRLLEE